MSQNYAVQNNGPSGLAWGTTGAIAGAGVGAALAKWTDFGIKTQAHKSWEEAVAAVNKDDKFVKKQIEKAGDNVDNWKLLDGQSKAVKEAKDEILKAFPENLRNHADVHEYIDEYAKRQELFKTEHTKVLEKYKKGELNDVIKSSLEIDDYVNNLENVKAQNTLVETAENKVKNIAGVGDDIIKNVDKKIGNLTEQRMKAASSLTDDVLKTLKKPSMKWTALAGAAILGLGALLVRPKNKQV